MLATFALPKTKRVLYKSVRGQKTLRKKLKKIRKRFFKKFGEIKKSLTFALPLKRREYKNEKRSLKDGNNRKKI
jgi:hypothetical protein